MDDNLPLNYIKNDIIFITGASIGSKICEEIMNFRPKILVLLDNSELALYNIQKVLTSIKNINIKIIPILGSIQDLKKNVIK